MTPVRVSILANPKSGRGRGRRVAEKLDEALRARGFRVLRVPFAPHEGAATIRECALASDVMVLAGGDGTVHHALPGLIGTPAAVYHLPMGTENLFSREFLHTPRIEDVVAAVERGAVGTIDVPTVDTGDGAKHFAIMASIGPDSSVIRRMHAFRTGPISHLDYARPIVRELLNPYLPELTIDVDGERVVLRERGLVVVANSRQYALRIDPAADADPTDGKLDVVFMPAPTPLEALARVIDARRREHRDDVVRVRGTRVHVESPTPDPAMQADGELAFAGTAPLRVSFEVTGARLRVLLGAGAILTR